MRESHVKKRARDSSSSWPLLSSPAFSLPTRSLQVPMFGYPHSLRARLEQSLKRLHLAHAVIQSHGYMYIVGCSALRQLNRSRVRLPHPHIDLLWHPPNLFVFQFTIPATIPLGSQRSVTRAPIPPANSFASFVSLNALTRLCAHHILCYRFHARYRPPPPLPAVLAPFHAPATSNNAKNPEDAPNYR